MVGSGSALFLCRIQVHHHSRPMARLVARVDVPTYLRMTESGSLPGRGVMLVPHRLHVVASTPSVPLDHCLFADPQDFSDVGPGEALTSGEEDRVDFHRMRVAGHAVGPSNSLESIARRLCRAPCLRELRAIFYSLG